MAKRLVLRMRTLLIRRTVSYKLITLDHECVSADYPIFYQQKQTFNRYLQKARLKLFTKVNVRRMESVDILLADANRARQAEPLQMRGSMIFLSPLA